MCDCPQERDNKIVGKTTETVTIFSRCPAPYRPGKDILNYKAPTVTDQPDKNDDYVPIVLVQPNSSDTLCDSIQSPSTSTYSSSDSSRTYKFVCLAVRDHRSDEAEEETVKPPSVCLDTDRVERIVDYVEPDVECTLAIIKPEAVHHRREIERRIYTEGFEICRTRWLRLTPEQASEFYDDRFGEPSFPYLVAYMSARPVIVHVLARQNAVREWRRIAGPDTVSEARLYYPDSVRALYGRIREDFENAVHASDTCERAEKEIHFFFPDFVTEPLLTGYMAEDLLLETINSVLVEGLTLCCKLKPADPVLWLANWLLLNNPNKPKLSGDLALIPS